MTDAPDIDATIAQLHALVTTLADHRALLRKVLSEILASRDDFIFRGSVPRAQWKERRDRALDAARAALIATKMVELDAEERK